MIKREMDLSAQICLIRACGPGISGIFLKFATKLKDECIINTDKRTDVWSRDFLIWKINFGLWAVAWAG